jgi:predicted small lipoprotein YifL
MKPLLMLICAGGLVAGCGQKGPLYLPDKNASVVTRPAPSAAPAPPTSPAAPDTGTPPTKPQDKNDDSQSSTPPRN